MNVEQVKSDLRTLVATFGGLLAGWLVAHGWASDSATVMTLLLAMTPLLANLIVGISGHFTHTDANAILVADANPNVAGVVTKNTPDGRSLAAEIPSNTVAAAGTPAAAAIASK